MCKYKQNGDARYSIDRLGAAFFYFGLNLKTLEGNVTVGAQVSINIYKNAT